MAEDYHDHNTSAVDCLAGLYANFQSESFQECQLKMTDNITDTISNNATVNHTCLREL